jgi:hypothetical protein
MKPPPDCPNPNHFMDAREAASTMVFKRADGTVVEPPTDEEVEVYWQRFLGLTDSAQSDAKSVADAALAARLAKDRARRERLNG